MKIRKIITILVFLILIGTTSYAKYKITESIPIFFIQTIKQTKITGKIITENINNVYQSTVKLYKHPYICNDIISEPVESIQTNLDGTFEFIIKDDGIYDIIIDKPGYLNYTVTEIEIEKGEEIELDEYKLIAGDVVKSGEIQIFDLVDLNDHIGKVITNPEADSNAIYDLNEDGKVTSLDRKILKNNYGKLAETVKWTKSNS